MALLHPLKVEPHARITIDIYIYSPSTLPTDNPPPKPKRPPKELLNRYSHPQEPEQHNPPISKPVSILQSLFGRFYIQLLSSKSDSVCYHIVFLQHGDE